MLSYWSTDCAVVNFKPWVMLRDQRGNQPSKIQKIWFSWAILLGFLRSLLSAVRHEANTIWATCRAKRGPSARTPSKCWGTCSGARSVSLLTLAQHVVAANVRAEVRARMHNWSIWCQGSDWLVAHNSLRDGSLENETCARGSRGNQQRKTQRVEGEILTRIVQSIQLDF